MFVFLIKIVQCSHATVPLISVYFEQMFEAKMAGGINDPDDLVVAAFKAFDEEGRYLYLIFQQNNSVIFFR